MYDLISIVILVFGVLQIILFFKVWGMTNNVKKITDGLNLSKDKALRAALAGDEEELKKILVASLIDDLIMNYKDGFNSYRGGEFHVIEKYQTAFNKLGIEIPENLKKIKSAIDIDTLLNNYGGKTFISEL